MVEMSMSSNPNSQLDVKLCLDLSAKQMSPVVKRVRATDYATLMAQAVGWEMGTLPHLDIKEFATFTQISNVYKPAQLSTASLEHVIISQQPATSMHCAHPSD